MERAEAWAFSRLVLMEDEREPTFRVSPLFVRVPIEDLLQRRSQLYDSLAFSQERKGLWSVEASATVPSTSVRPEKQVSARFVVAEIGDGLAGIVSTTDRNAYAHCIERLEAASYPLATRMFVPIEASVRRLEDRLGKTDISLTALQIRGAGTETREKIQLFGRFKPSDAIDRLVKDAAVPQSIRLGGSSVHGASIRVRLDTGCRLLVEKWRVDDWTPLDALHDLATLATESKGRYDVSTISSTSSTSTVAVVEFRGADDWSRFGLVVRLLDDQPGISVLDLTDAREPSMRVIDLLTGVNCTVSPLGRLHLAVQADKPIHVSFIDTLKSLLVEIDGAGAEENGVG